MSTFSTRVLPAGLGAALTAAALTGLAACNKPEPPRPSAAPPPNIAQRVQVLNADTLVIDGQHLRLVGFYAPQGIPDARCWAEALASKQAAEALRRMVATANSVRFETVGGVDVFNRKYAKVTLSGLDLGEALYEEGLVARTQAAFNWCGPLSGNEAGAPELRNLFDVGR